MAHCLVCAVVDGGRWYIEPLKQLGIKRVVMRYGVRNYVERFSKTLKRRLKKFNGVKVNFQLHLKEYEWRC